MRDSAVVMFPAPVVGHLVSMVELANLIKTSQPSLSIHILVATPPYQASAITSFISSVSAPVTFHHLPQITLSPETAISASNHHEIIIFEILRLSTPHVRQFLLSLSNDITVSALVMDFFCFEALSVAEELNVPGYFFITSGVGCLNCFAYLSTLHKTITQSFKELNGTLIDIPGIPPIPASEMPKPVTVRNDKSYKNMLGFCLCLPRSAGLIVNSFVSLEKRALEALSEGKCFPESATTPPIYCIGPLIKANKNISADGGVPECLSWLDSQPSGSVVFLCFGSLGLFSKEQLQEIAIGLERSKHRFLWVVRSPPSEGDKDVAISALPDRDLDELLPRGFLERTKETGFVVKSWAPQMEVLNHKAVGGFVTHCGWNSTLESISAGVPLIAWPLYAEQKFNKVLLVEEMEIALPISRSESGWVSCEEVERRVRQLMESKEGESVRKKINEFKDQAKAALSHGGSSRIALTELLGRWK